MVCRSVLLIIMFGLYQDCGGDKPPLYVFSQVVSLSSNMSSSPPTSDVDIETVLGDQVMMARCQVTCMTQLSPCDLSPMCGHCLHVCRLLVETPAWFNICSAPRLCRPGCQVACGSRAFSSPPTADMETRSGRHTLTTGKVIIQN